jgi:hypothetical protein
MLSKSYHALRHAAALLYCVMLSYIVWCRVMLCDAVQVVSMVYEESRCDAGGKLDRLCVCVCVRVCECVCVCVCLCVCVCVCACV